MAQVSQTRTIRGYAIIAKGDEPRRVGEGAYEVRSQSGSGFYQLTKHNTGWSCSCPDFVNRHEEVGDCKHVAALRLWLRAKDETERTDIFELPKTVLSFNHCRFCNSVDLLRWGYRETRQGKRPRFKCRTCGKRFVADEGFLKSRFDPKIVTLALDLYFKGASLRKVTQHIAQFYGVKMNESTVLRWIRKFSELIDTYANTLRPELSGAWNCDEMKTKMAHETPINGDRHYWLWNALDNGSRYLVASHLTKGRSQKDAQAFFEVAKKQAKRDPQVIFSDGLLSYRDAYDPISLANYRKVAHIANVGIRSHMGNHRVERLHNSMREREKVMRHLKKANSAEKVFKGYRAYYNFVRPHMALDGHTPASNVLKRVSKVSAKVHGELRDPTQVGSDVLEYLHGTIEEHAKIKAIAKPYVLAVLLRTPDGTDFAYWERSLHFGKVEDYDWSWNANETLTGEREGESVLQWYSRNQTLDTREPACMGGLTSNVFTSSPRFGCLMSNHFLSAQCVALGRTEARAISIAAPVILFEGILDKRSPRSVICALVRNNSPFVSQVPVASRFKTSHFR